MTTEPRAIVVFDGDCGLCNGFVAWLIRHDPDRRFLIAGSAGSVGQSAITAMGLESHVAASTLVVATQDGPHLRSDAVAAVASRLQWPWRGGAALRVFPRRMRDGVYAAVAKRRPRRPAEDPACGTPPPGLVAEWRARLATAQDVTALMGSAPHPPA